MFEDALPDKVKAVLDTVAPIITAQNFYLAGGTGLALQIGHRISEDLDFFRESVFDASSLFRLLRDSTTSFKDILLESHTLSAEAEGVRCSFIHYDVRLVLEPVTYKGMRVAEWRDIVAEKFKTIAQRGSKKDFYDVFAAIRLGSLTIGEAVGIFRKRFENTGLNLYHVLRSLTFFEDAEAEPDPALTGRARFSWQDVKSFFEKNIKEFEKHFMT
jgi:hypothetical protein